MSAIQNQAEFSFRPVPPNNSPTHLLNPIFQPLYQVSIEQMDPAELAQQRTKLLQRTSGFRGQSSIVHQLSCSSHLQHHQLQQAGSAGRGGHGVIDILAAPSRMTLGVQAQLLEKQGLCIADELRDFRQIRTKDDRDLVCHLREERI